MLKNPQKPMPVDRSSGETLSVHSIFPTLQGEGPHSGKRAVFIRLAGCNLQCPLCDTEYTEGAKDMDCRDIVATCRELSTADLVVLTGGEPARQDIATLVDDLICHGYHVQIETNGKLPLQGDQSLWAHWLGMGGLTIVVSPKTARIDGFMMNFATAYKYVLRAGEIADDGLPTLALDNPLGRGDRVARPPGDFAGDIFVHPADEQDLHLNSQNLDAATTAVVAFDDSRRRLGMQIHKLAGLA